MKYLRLEQQYIFNTSLKKVFDIYREYWDNLMNICTYYKKDKREIDKSDKDDLFTKINQKYSYIYRQGGIVVVNLKSARSTLERIPSMKLSRLLKTIVVDLSSWESFNLTIADTGNILFSIELYEPDDKICDIRGSDPRFSSIIEKLDEIRKDSSPKITAVREVLGDDFENVLSITKLDLARVVKPMRKYIEEAVVFQIH